MTLTQILQKIRAAFYTRAEIDSMGGGNSLDTTIRSKANASDLNNYLPLSGGVLTGSDLTRNVTTSHLQLHGGTTINDGAYLSLGGKDFDARPGAFLMVARNAENYHAFIGRVDGSLTWDNKNIDLIDSQGANWIRYSNGIQICFGVAIPGQDNAFPKSFKSGTIPDINLTHYTSNNMSYSATVQSGTGGSTNNTTFNFLLCQLSTGSYVGYACHYTAIGYWK